MYVLTITNTIANRNETFVYDDNNFNPEAVLNVFTEELLSSVVQTYLGESATLDRKTYRACGELLENVLNEAHYADGLESFLTIIQDAPKVIPNKIKELHECWSDPEFESLNEEFYDELTANVGSIVDYYVIWTLFESGEIHYLVEFEAPEGYIYVELEHKDTYDTLD